MDQPLPPVCALTHIARPDLGETNLQNALFSYVWSRTDESLHPR